MTNKRSGAVKGLVLFMVVMVAITFCSRTIYYGTLPKVEAQAVNGGVLQITVVGEELLLDADRMERVEIPVNLSDAKLKVEDVLVLKHGAVQVGTKIVQFDPMLGVHVLVQSESALRRAQEALDAWDRAYRAAWDKLQADRRAVEKKMRELGADLDALQLELEKLEQDQTALEHHKLVDGTSRTDREEALADAQAKTDALAQLRDQDWLLLSSTQGVVAEVMAKPGDEYGGLLPLAKLIPSDAKLRVGVECADSVEINDPERVLVYDGDVVQRGEEAAWAFDGESEQGGKRVLWARHTHIMPDLSKLTKLSFRIESDYRDCLVPSSAVIGGNTVYILETRIGAWGQDELYAKKVDVRGLQSDGSNTSVASGLWGMDRVITKWDRPFGDGDTVALPLE